MTAYQANGSNVAASVLAIANKAAKATGGTETSNTIALTASTTGWIILRSQGAGTAQAGAGSEPTISDSNMYGWFQDDNTFDGQTIGAGFWTPKLVFKGNNASAATADIHCVIVKRPNGGGAYTVVGDLALTGQTISSVRRTYTFSASSLSSASFATGDRLGYVYIINITSGNAGLTLLTLYMSTSTTTGVANDAQLASPGYSTSGTLVTKSTGLRLRLVAQKIASTGLRLRLAGKNTRSAGLRLHLSTGIASGGFCLYANGTGVASFDDFRVTAYPDPSLALEPVGRLGSSFVSWNALFPSPATTLGMFTSLRGDGSDWVDVSQQSGGPIPGLYGQPDPTIDGFSVDSHMNYSATNQTGGTAPTVTYDTAHSRITLTGGTNGLYLYNGIARADIDELTIIDTADAGGLVWRFVDSSNYYVLVVSDHLASIGTPQRATLYSVKAGAQTQLAQATITFVRSTFHVFRVLMLGGAITATMDGAALFSYTDSTPLGIGNVGLYNNGGATGSRYYQLWIQPQGDNLLNTYIYTQQSPTTTDATVTPQLLDMTVAAFNPNIGPGALIPSADYRHTFVDKNWDDLATQSGDYSWFIDQNLQFYFRKRTAIPAPWVLYSVPFGVAAAVDLEADSNLSVTVANDLYRNRQTLKNVINSGVFSDSFIGDGTKTSFTLRYLIAPGTVPVILLNNAPQSVALKGQTGAQWYYAQGDAVIAQDANGTVLVSTDTLSVPNYTGTFSDTITVDNVAAQAALAQQINPGGLASGIVEAVEDVSSLNMSYAAGLVYAGAKLARYCINNARTLTFTTLRNGLQVGMIQSVFVVEENLWDAQMLITAIDPITIKTQPGDTIQYTYLVTASELPPIASWSKLFGSGLLLS